MRNFEKFSKERYTPLYPFEKGIKGYILGNDRYCGDIIMQKSICADLFAHKRVRNLGQAERFRVRDVHMPLVSKEDWREIKSRVSMPDREAVILEDITGEGVLAELHSIQFKEDIDV